MKCATLPSFTFYIAAFILSLQVPPFKFLFKTWRLDQRHWQKPGCPASQVQHGLANLRRGRLKFHRSVVSVVFVPQLYGFRWWTTTTTMRSVGTGWLICVTLERWTNSEKGIPAKDARTALSQYTFIDDLLQIIKMCKTFSGKSETCVESHFPQTWSFQSREETLPGCFSAVFFIFNYWFEWLIVVHKLDSKMNLYVSYLMTHSLCQIGCLFLVTLDWREQPIVSDISGFGGSRMEQWLRVFASFSRHNSFVLLKKTQKTKPF